MSFVVIIPARFQSSRFPGKPLADILGKPMIQHVVERAKEAGAQQIIVATDDDRIANVVKGFCDVCMTSPTHQSGTQRIAEVIEQRNISDETIVVNVQGDEPFVPAANIRQVADNLATRNDASIATLSTTIATAAEVHNPNVVKVIAGANGKAIYFSRSVIPFERERMMADPAAADPALYRRHIGLYAYRAAYVKQYVEYPECQLETLESLEQLRALWNDDVIIVEDAIEPPPVGIDTPEDLKLLLSQLTVQGNHL